MNDNQYIRELYHALVGINKVIESIKDGYVNPSTVKEYETFLWEVKDKSPGLLNDFDRRDYYINNYSYSKSGILANIARNLGKLKVKVDSISDSPIVSSKSFHFIGDLNLRKILERDYIEIQKNVISQNWKST